MGLSGGISPRRLLHTNSPLHSVPGRAAAAAVSVGPRPSFSMESEGPQRNRGRRRSRLDDEDDSDDDDSEREEVEQDPRNAVALAEKENLEEAMNLAPDSQAEER